MSSSASAFQQLLSLNQPQFQTQQALLILGLQHDFISPDGKLPIHQSTGLVDRIRRLVPKFRELAGDVIWVRTCFEAERMVNEGGDDGEVIVADGSSSSNSSSSNKPPPSATTKKQQKQQKQQQKPQQGSKSKSSVSKKMALKLLQRVSTASSSISSRKKGGDSSDPQIIRHGDDGGDNNDNDDNEEEEEEELFLSRTPLREPCCLPGSAGAEFDSSIKHSIDQSADIIVDTTHYSAFLSTSLLSTLRTKLITELYVCGCMTNISVYATMRDAGKHGITINIIDDCLGFRSVGRHEAALQQMMRDMGAQCITSVEILSDLDSPPLDDVPTAAAAATADDGKLSEAIAGLNIKTSHSESEKGNEAAARNALDDALESLGAGLAGVSISSSSSSRPKTGGGGPKDSNGQLEVPKLLRSRSSMPDVNRGYIKSRIRMRPRESIEGENARTDSVQPSSAKKTVQDAESSRSKDVVVVGSAAVNESGSATTLKEITAQQPEQVDVKKNGKSKHKRNRSSKGKNSGSSSNTNQGTAEQTEKTLKSGSDTAAKPVESTSDTASATKPRQSSSNSTKAIMPKRKLPSLANLPTLGPSDEIGEGDSFIRRDLLSTDQRDAINPSLALCDTIFHGLYHEVAWQKMYHAAGEVPRLVAVQGSIGDDGSKPIYRHPSDQSPPLLPFTPKVKLVKEAAEEIIGHPLNHVLIQLYRDGKDYISEHSDKTLDIAKGSKIVNASFGAKRTMRLRRKRKLKMTPDTMTASSTTTMPPTESQKDGEPEPEPRETQRIPMPHNSLFVLGLESNKAWLHGINADKRLPAERDADELAYDGMRISLTFRQIGTFLSNDEAQIWGQGATAKSKEQAAKVVIGDGEETDRLIRAFGRENHEDETWDWDEAYGAGFDVLHFRAS